MNIQIRTADNAELYIVNISFWDEEDGCPFDSCEVLTPDELKERLDELLPYQCITKDTAEVAHLKPVD